MKGIIAAIVSALFDSVVKLIKGSKPEHMEGYSNGTTEKDLEDKVRKNGWAD